MTQTISPAILAHRAHIHSKMMEHGTPEHHQRRDDADAARQRHESIHTADQPVTKRFYCGCGESFEARVSGDDGAACPGADCGAVLTQCAQTLTPPTPKQEAPTDEPATQND